MHVDVRAFVDRDEAVTLFGVEPFDRALSHPSLPSCFAAVSDGRHTERRCPKRSLRPPSAVLGPALTPERDVSGQEHTFGVTPRSFRAGQDPRPAQPPATAGIIETDAPSGVGVPKPWAKRTSSSFTY